MNTATAIVMAVFSRQRSNEPFSGLRFKRASKSEYSGMQKNEAERTRFSISVSCRKRLSDGRVSAYALDAGQVRVVKEEDL